MGPSFKNRRDKGENSLEQLQQKTDRWIARLYESAETVRFFNKYLRAPIFKIEHGVFEKLESFKIQLEEIRLLLHDLNTLAYNHKHDLEGMRECEEVNCDVFYEEQHIELRHKIAAFLKSFKRFQLEIFNYTENLLDNRTQAVEKN